MGTLGVRTSHVKQCAVTMDLNEQTSYTTLDEHVGCTDVTCENSDVTMELNKQIIHHIGWARLSVS